MCGIGGFVGATQDLSSSGVLENMARVLAYRGPDHAGCVYQQAGSVGLMHRRLSFLDTSPAGHQPMWNANHTLALTFNGEIYNFRTLRTELEKAGHTFRTHSDSEVIMYAFQQWGEKAWARLEGMFALALWDESNQQLWLVRDRFGIKPLYYTVQNQMLVFGSELKALMQVPTLSFELRPDFIPLFLANRYIPTPGTPWKNVFKQEPGTAMCFDVRTRRLLQNQYWQFEFDTQKPAPDQAQAQITTLFKQSVSAHLESDVPIGSFLSGGMDSTALVSEMKNRCASAFSIGFPNWEKSEHITAQAVANALHVPLHTQLLQEHDFDLLPQLMYHYDDPIADISILPTYAVSQLAHKHVKAVFSGEGADETFGGYWWTKAQAAIPFYKRLFSGYTAHKNEYIQAMAMGLFNRETLHNTLHTSHPDIEIPDDVFAHFDRYRLPAGTPAVQQFQYWDFKTFMQDLVLPKVDRASMANSLEVRVPFLYTPLVQLVTQWHPSVWLRPHTQKWLVKGLLPATTPAEVYTKPKQGFVGPDPFYAQPTYYQNVLLNGQLVKQGYVKLDFVHTLLKQQQYWHLWKLTVLEHWMQTWYFKSNGYA